MTIDIDSHYPLTADQVASFRQNGFIKLRDVLSRATLEFYAREITRLTIALNTQDKPLEQRSTYDKAFLQVMNLWERSPLVGRFVMGQRLARIAAELLEVTGVRLYHDQSLYKEPGGGITPAHADQYYWPLASDRTVTAWIPLQAVPPEMGPLGFFAGSQSVEFGRELGISDASEAAISANMARNDFEYVEWRFRPRRSQLSPWLDVSQGGRQHVEPSALRHDGHLHGCGDATRARAQFRAGQRPRAVVSRRRSWRRHRHPQEPGDLAAPMSPVFARRSVAHKR